MKTTVALFIALVTLLPHSANATTLTITSGSIVLNQGVEACCGSLMTFGGDDFFVYQIREPGFFGEIRSAFGVEPFVESILIYTGIFGIADVQVGSQQCLGSIFLPCGDITLTSPGFAMPAVWPIDTPFVANMPFTATGQLLVEGNQYDIVGHGTVTGTRCLTPCDPLSLRTRLSYSFSVDEPSSLVLMFVSTIALGIAFVVRKRSVLNT